MGIETKAKKRFKNWWTDKEVYFWLDYSSSTSFAITNFDDCLKVKFYGHTEPQLVPELLFKVSVRELHNNLDSDSDKGGLKESID